MSWARKGMEIYFCLVLMAPAAIIGALLGVAIIKRLFWPGGDEE